MLSIAIGWTLITFANLAVFLNCQIGNLDFTLYGVCTFAYAIVAVNAWIDYFNDNRNPPHNS